MNSVAFTPTLADVLDAQQLAAPNPWRRSLFEAALFGLTCAVTAKLGGSRSDLSVAGFSTGLASAYAALVALARRGWLRFRVGRLYRRHGPLGETHLGSWDETGLASEVAGVRIEVPWSRMVRRRENGRTVLLYGASATPFFIPKRALSPAHLASLRPYLDRIPIERPLPRPSRGDASGDPS